MAGSLRIVGPPASAPPATTMAVFDLDRTLVAGSSLARLARALAEAKVVRRKELAGHLLREAFFAARGMGPAAIDRLRASLLQAATGLELGPLVEIANSIGPAIAAEIYPGARWLLDRHRADGHEVVLLSSSPHQLVAAVAAAIHPGIIPIGTLLEVADGRLTGHMEGSFCHGWGKLVRLEESLGWRDLTCATAYADSATDLPVLRACGTPVAVNPDRVLRATAASAGWPILDLS